ncbi:SHOCT domain-containing protein [Sphaerisporangium perillae]|uniref:SHOCT domain-containing protein n=1 Tax=Sphaerisporangium perillae TaxID=2935860 RepID=UPI00200D5DB9|nr:SHOCT domain-containing protein [Sphaerisporangium perillae]
MITPPQLIRKSIGILLGLGGLTCCLTMLFLTSRQLMSIGGSCASGGPYVVATPCPDGAWLIPVSIVGGVVALGVYAVSVLPVGPRWAPLAWPALFLSLGWNFLQGALSGPEVEWGFMVCAIVFGLMGGLPLLALFGKDARRAVFWGRSPRPATPSPARATGPGHLRWTTSVVLPGENDAPRGAPSWEASPQDAPPRDAPPRDTYGGPRSRFVGLTPVDAPAGADDLVDRLERLAALHAAGRLDDAEYAAAKARLLNGSH